jgi:hypothetical protein
MKYIFTDKYNWEDYPLMDIVNESGVYIPIPIAEYSDVFYDSYLTRISVTGINSVPNAKIVDVTQGPLKARVGDRLMFLYKNDELEEKLGETRIGCLEQNQLCTPESLRKTARSMAKQAFRQKKTVAFTVSCGELVIDIDLLDPIGIYSDETQQVELYEVVSLNWNVSKFSMAVDIEARSYPI